MNIPEGWPTEEMIAAARDIPQIGHSSYYWRQVILNVLAAAPTPPLQKDEPVAYRWVESKFDCWRYDETPNPHRQCEPLYTCHGNSELKKAAEEALKLLINLESGYGFEDESEYAVLDNLRAALEAT